MIVFGIVVLLLSAGVAVAILRGAAAGAQAVVPENPALALHRRELAEVESLAERGLLAEDEYAALRAETARRLLAAAAEAAPAAVAPRKADRRLVFAGAALAPVLALALYAVIGAPGDVDQPFDKRLAQWRTHPDTLTVPEMSAILTKVTKERPKEPDAWRALGIAQMASNKPLQAQVYFRRAVDLAPRRPDLWVSLGESFISASTDGAVTEDAAAAFKQALVYDPANLLARYYLAQGQLQSGDKAGGVAALKALQASLPAEDQRRAVIQSDIDSAQGSTGPTAAQVAAAQGQVGAPQIQAMVARLAARLQANPADSAGWVQLVRAYGVLGDAAKRDAALKTARAQFANNPEVLKALDAAAAGARP